MIGQNLNCKKLQESASNLFVIFASPEGAY